MLEVLFLLILVFLMVEERWAEYGGSNTFEQVETVLLQEVWKACDWLVEHVACNGFSVLDWIVPVET